MGTIVCIFKDSVTFWSLSSCVSHRRVSEVNVTFLVVSWGYVCNGFWDVQLH